VKLDVGVAQCNACEQQMAMAVTMHSIPSHIQPPPVSI